MYTFWDLFVFIGYFVVIVALGFASGRGRQMTVDGYFRGGNRLPWYAIGFSIIAAGISSEQFVGEMGYAYKLGMPVVNWEWLVFPALSILLWIFVPLVRAQPHHARCRSTWSSDSAAGANALRVADRGQLRVRELRPGVLHRRIRAGADVGHRPLAAVWLLACVHGPVHGLRRA